MKSNKGFTLIELLAVIVVLAIIALIATPMVLNTIADAKRGAARNSAYAYIHAVEMDIAVEMITNETLTGTTTITDVTAYDLKGDKPSAATLKFEEGVVTDGSTVTVNGWQFTYDGTELSKGTEVK